MSDREHPEGERGDERPAREPDDEGPPTEERGAEDVSPEQEPPERGLDTDETSRLGLTEEFSRIESEIEDESFTEEPAEGRSGAAAGEPVGADTGEWAVEPDDAEDDEGWPDDADWTDQRDAGEADAGYEDDDGDYGDDDAGYEDDDGDYGDDDAGYGDDDGDYESGEADHPAEVAHGSNDDETDYEDDGSDYEASGDATEGVGDAADEDGPAGTADEQGDRAVTPPAATPAAAAAGVGSAARTGGEQGDGGADPASEGEDEGQPAPVGGEDVTRVESPATEHRVPPPPPRPGGVGGFGGTGGYGPAPAEEELEDKTPSLILRFLAGSVLIVASIATAVAVTGLLFLSDVAAQLQPIPGIQQQLAAVDPGAPQTILIIGSDRREGAPKEDQRSDTTMLLRVDPDKDVLSLFSLPRDLKVDIPGYGVGKLNEAYSEGGEKLTLETVKRFTGLDVNHVVEINFAGFADAVNAIDCVYIDLDRKYFNDNSTAATPEEEYAEIDINAGYQRLCGLKALQYVRYRHADTDLVRAARQQDFLREARQKVEPRQLLGAVFGTGTGNELINIFTDYTRSDISSEDDVIGILKSFASMRNVPVNEVHFEGDIGGPDDPYVTSTDKQVRKAIDEFLNGVGSEGQRGGAGASEKKGGGKDKKKKKKKNPAAGADVQDTEGLADPTGRFPTLAERFQADAEKNARRLGIPVFYPTKVVPGSAFSPDSRTYQYKNEEDQKEDGYKTVISWTTPSTLTEYYGVMGTTWNDPPILRNPSETRTIGGREYLLFYDGGRLRQVGWREKGNAYWLSNTLPQSIGEAEMIAIATSMREV